MPALEMAQETGRLVSWLKREGEFVNKGEPLMEIETDKVTIEIESPGSGVLSGIRAQDDEDVPVGQVIAFLISEGETPPASEYVPSSIVASPVARRIAAEHGLELSEIAASSGQIGKAEVLAHIQAQPKSIMLPTSQKTLASPKARRLAIENSLSLDTFSGSGPYGAVIVRDVLADIQQFLEPSALSIEAREYRVVPMIGIRKTIAERLQVSYQTAPHISLTLSIDMTETLRLFEQSKEIVESRSGHPLTLTTVLSRVVSTALLKHPRINAHLVGAEIHEYAAVHLGIAVALDEGLIVPIIRHVERKGLASLQADLQDVTTRAREGNLSPNEVRGGTFTLSNLGMFGIEQFTAILNPPQVGILAIGTIKETAVGVDGQLALRPIMQMTLNADHRVVDGAVGAGFLKTLKELLEAPYQLLLDDFVG